MNKYIKIHRETLLKDVQQWLPKAEIKEDENEIVICNGDDIVLSISKTPGQYHTFRVDGMVTVEGVQPVFKINEPPKKEVK